MRLIFSILFCAAFPSVSIASDAAVQSCVDVYKNSTRNMSLSQQNNVELARSFSSFCKKDGSTNSSANGVGLDAVIESIPFKFSADSKNSSDKLVEFCRIGQSQFDSWSSSIFASSTVANEALSNFNNCIQLSNSGLQLSFVINQPNSLVVSGFPNAGYSGFFTSVAYDNQTMKCSSSDFNSQHQAKEINGSVHLKINEPFAITCIKEPQLANDGHTKYYPRTTLTLTAGAVSPLAIVFPSDTLGGYELASQAALAVAQATNEVSVAKSEADNQKQLVNSLQHRISGVTTSITTHELGSGTAWGCGPYGSDWGRALTEEAQRICGANKFVIGSNNVRTGGQCGFGSIGFACVFVPAQ